MQSEGVSFDECWKQHNAKVLEDIKLRFLELKVLNDKSYVFEYNQDDLDKAALVIGGQPNSHLESLFPLYKGGSIGDRRFFIVRGQADKPAYGNSIVGYFVYKKTDGTNVMIKMKPGKEKWEIVKQQEKKGKAIGLSGNCAE